MIQAKGHEFTTQALLGSTALGVQFSNGHYATIYLSPRDYHRVHMPCTARLLRMVHIPGKLHSVNALTAQNIPDLYASNERVVCLFEEHDGAFGPQGRHFAMVLVGATIVGSIATEWHGVVTPPHNAGVREWDYEKQHIIFRKGSEMGRFLLGSTVIVLFPESDLEFNPRWKPGRHVRVGEHMASNTAV
jgi:phosphatidylserine decarboxylase